MELHRSVYYMENMNDHLSALDLCQLSALDMYVFRFFYSGNETTWINLYSFNRDNES